MTGGARPILVIGDVIDDIIVVPAGPIRHETDTLSTIVSTQGGSAANVAAWLGSLGAAVRFVGRVGAGDGPRHRASLEAFGVEALIDEDPVLATGRIIVIVDGDRRSFLTDGGAARSLSPAVLDDEQLGAASALHLTGHSMLDAWRRVDTAALVPRAKAAGLDVTVDPSSAGFLRDIGAQTFLDTIAGTDVLLPNRAEAEALTGEDDPRLAAEALLEIVPAVVITLGGEGVFVAERGERGVHLPAPRVRVVDPTGAGDAFAAGFLAARHDGADVTVAARRAIVVAAGALGRAGGRPIA